MRIKSKYLLALAVISLVTIPVCFSEELTQQREVQYATLEDKVDPETGAEYSMATIYLDTTWDDIDYLLHDGTFLIGIVLLILGTALMLRTYGRGRFTSFRY